MKCKQYVDTHAVESVDKGIVNEEVLAQDIKDCGALAQHEKNGCDDSKWSIKQCENSSLWQVGEREHECRDSQAEAYSGSELGQQRFP